MTIPLHILTAVSRAECFLRLAQHLATADITGLAVHWHVGFDWQQRHVGGQAVKNRLLDNLTEGWVWICDDDNLPHPQFFARLPLLCRAHPGGFIVGQQRSKTHLIQAQAPRLDGIDIAQAVLPRASIGALRIPERYNGDGTFLEQIHAQTPLTLVGEILSYWNAQQWQ